MAKRKEWSPAHEQLRKSMQKEVSILRELLANLFQEELFLSRRDSKGIYIIQEDRSELLKSLSSLRKERLHITQEIKNRLTIQNHKKLNLEQLLPPGNENTSQVLSLREQMRSLFEKLSDQKTRNLFLHSQESTYQPIPAPQPKKKKSAVATYFDCE